MIPDKEVVVRYRNLIWVCLLAFVLPAALADAQFADPRVLGGELIRDLQPVYPNQEEAAPSTVKVGQSGLIFLSFPTDARRGAMADAGVGLLGDGPGAVFLNPGLLGYVHNREAFFSHVEWIADTKHSTAGFIWQFPNLPGSFSLGYILHDSGTINGTTIDPNPASNGFRDTGTFSTTDYALSGGWGFQITDRFSVGAQLRFAHQDLGTASGASGAASINAVAVDLGTYFNTGFRNMVLAMSVRNFSEEKEFLRERFELPRTFRLGAVIDMVSMWGNTPVPHHFDFLAEIDSPIDFDERILLGAEYRFKRPDQSFGVALRGGYKLNHDTEDYSMGGGITYETESNKGVRIDYAFKHFNGAFFDPVQMITGAISF
jgi:hypothetical protein